MRRSHEAIGVLLLTAVAVSVTRWSCAGAYTATMPEPRPQFDISAPPAPMYAEPRPQAPVPTPALRPVAPAPAYAPPAAAPAYAPPAAAPVAAPVPAPVAVPPPVYAAPAPVYAAPAPVPVPPPVQAPVPPPVQAPAQAPAQAQAPVQTGGPARLPDMALTPDQEAEARVLLAHLQEHFVANEWGALINKRMLTFNEPNPRFIFSHVPKAGGNSVRFYMSKLLAQYNTPPGETEEHWDSQTEIGCKWVDKFAWFRNHLTTRMAVDAKRQCARERPDRPIVVFTVWREPLSAWHSAFRWISLSPSNLHCHGEGHKMPKNPGVADLSRHHCKLVSIPNFQSCWQWGHRQGADMISATPTAETDADCGGVRVDTDLFKDVDFLVFTEHLQDMHNWVPQLLHINKDVPNESKNVNKKLKPRPLSPAERERGGELLAKDVMVDRVLRDFYATFQG